MYITSTTSNVTAILSRDGKQILADNSSLFKITGFKFSDDEINYSLYDGSSQDAANTDILNLPILEPSSNGNGGAAVRYELLSLNFGVLNLAEIITNLPDIISFNTNTLDFFIKTLRAFDSVYYLNSSNNDVISVNQGTIETSKDPDISQTLQKQSYASTKLIIRDMGTAVIQITGSNSKSFYKKTIIVTDDNIIQRPKSANETLTENTEITKFKNI
jgi:hypothetical protein